MKDYNDAHSPMKNIVSNMGDVEVWIEKAAIKLGINIERLEKQAAYAIVNSVKTRYVRGNPRSWWLGLALPFTKYDSSESSLSSVLPAIDGSVFFIPEIDTVDLPVYQLRAAILEPLLAECPYFEYYVAGGMLEWLVIESDHNVFYVCADKRVLGHE
jgi:hypothetical protein